MKNLAFTICSRSYIGMANVLRKSFLRYNPDYDFYIILADTDDEKFENCFYAQEILKNDISDEKYEEMSFKYDVTEFCTSLKPFIIKHFLNESYEFVSYFDPDICFYSRFIELEDIDKNIFITPHVISMRANYDGDEKEENFLKYGIYNCGFIAFRKSEISLSVLDWWSTKLLNYSFADAECGVYTDQKWIDFLPNFVDAGSLYIIHNLGCNIAPWNYHEREILFKNENYYVKERNNDNSLEVKLIFVHFSGYDYKKLMHGVVFHNYRLLKQYSDLLPILLNYGKELNLEETEKYFVKKYKYNNFSDGTIIFNIHRRLYRKLLLQNLKYENLFSENGEFYKRLKKSKMLVRTDSCGDVKYKDEVKNFDSKEKLVLKFYKIAFLFLGIRRFVEFLIALRFYSRFENQIDLLKK